MYKAKGSEFVVWSCGNMSLTLHNNIYYLLTSKLYVTHSVSKFVIESSKRPFTKTIKCIHYCPPSEHPLAMKIKNRYLPG